MERIEGTRVLVTGATSGIGAATARACAAAGARVAALGRRAELLQRLAAEAGVADFVCDIADTGATDAAVRAATAELGGLDAVVNCAGLMFHSRLGEGRREDWRAMTEVNLVGLLNLFHAVAPHLRAPGTSDLILVSSIGSRSVGASEFAVYSATKAAVDRLAEGMRLDLAGSDCRVAVLRPGFVDTDGGSAGVRDAELRAATRRQAREAGLQAGTVATEIVHLLALPPEVNVTELNLARTPLGPVEGEGR
jgi:NADP-dependent 3-hydroxy acid dehydrogenase YdfG